MKKELISIIKELQEIVKEGDLEVYDKDIVDFAIRIYISERIEIGKNKRIDTIQKSEANQDMATEKQINCLKNMGWDGDTSKITKMEARMIIKEKIGEKNKNDY